MMGRKLPITPKSRIKACFRMLQMTAREVQSVRKQHNNTCSSCGAKHSAAKGREVPVQVHHTRAINWERIYAVIREEMLDPANMTTLCTTCHDRVHAEQGDGWNEHKGGRVNDKPG